MGRIERILVIQTAFIGDVVLTLPLVQVLKEFFAGVAVDIMVVPRSAEVCRGHPDLAGVVVYDKRGNQRGIGGILRMARDLRARKYDLAVIPHRSLRSALVALLARIPLRIGFSKSAGWFLMNQRVRYEDSIHEIERNLSLLTTLGIPMGGKVLPRILPGGEARGEVDALLMAERWNSTMQMVALAPGTVWNTKRWLKEGFAALAALLVSEGHKVVLVGGPEDRELCEGIREAGGGKEILNAAGRLSLLGSAEFIRRCEVAVSNDSAPLHLAVAVGTPVVAIFGATVPEFGFAPYGPHDAVVEVRGLPCRPCSIHGGPECPIKTFDCMKNISAERVHARVMAVLERSRASRGED